MSEAGTGSTLHTVMSYLCSRSLLFRSVSCVACAGALYIHITLQFLKQSTLQLQEASSLLGYCTCNCPVNHTDELDNWQPFRMFYSVYLGFFVVVVFVLFVF